MVFCRCCYWIGVFGLTAAVISAAEKVERPDAGTPDAGTYVRALWAVQRFGASQAADPRHDEQTKTRLAAALAKDGTLTRRAIESELMDEKMFAELAGADGAIKPARVGQALDAAVPESRRRLLPAVAAHLDLLTTSFDRIDQTHLTAGDKLAEWIVDNYQAGKPLGIVFVCTGNSRRSILGATMGNLAAAYWGLPEIRCSSGGTAPSAFNRRSIRALESIGVEIEETGEEATRGAEGAPNPKYLVRWGRAAEGEAAMQTVEFSKHYADPANPHSGFAALMVCTQADAECPLVKGASRRISMPYLDPKAYDDSEYEMAKYAERRDDLGRLMLAVMLKARRQLEATGKIAQSLTAASTRK